jgi:hypothetical protein
VGIVKIHCLNLDTSFSPMISILNKDAMSFSCNLFWCTNHTDPTCHASNCDPLHDDARAGLINATAIATLGAFGGGGKDWLEDSGLHFKGLFVGGLGCC